jgi:ribonucleotide reductase alpha subunit
MEPRYSSYRQFKKLKEIRGKYLDVNLDESLKWNELRDDIKKYGMRNSNSLLLRRLLLYLIYVESRSQ